MSQFREIKLVRGRYSSKNSWESIRICFSYWGEGKSRLVIYISKHILKKLEITENARVRFFVDDQHPRQWLITPSDHIHGYKLTNTSAHSVKCQILWREDIPHAEERIARPVHFHLSEKGIQINAGFHATVSTHDLLE